jgi:hypothetical protein
MKSPTLSHSGAPAVRGPSGAHRHLGRQVHVHDKDQPDLPELLAEPRSVVDERPVGCRWGSCPRERPAQRGQTNGTLLG